MNGDEEGYYRGGVHLNWAGGCLMCVLVVIVFPISHSHRFRHCRPGCSCGDLTRRVDDHRALVFLSKRSCRKVGSLEHLYCSRPRAILCSPSAST